MLYVLMVVFDMQLDHSTFIIRSVLKYQSSINVLQQVQTIMLCSMSLRSLTSTAVVIIDGLCV